ncbi:MAG: DNA-directed RNA polymerase subunit D [Desulfurococcales archaeon]|nr:DNA-directed RNA polymerase subunit D [Desulfurococcales archaeon]
MTVSIKVVEKDENRVKLLIKGVHIHIVNAIRRAALEYVPTMAVDFVVFRTNTSVLHDEIIAHRIGLIPLASEEALKKYKSPEECSKEGMEEDPSCYAILSLEAEAGEDEIRTVYSGELKPLTDPDVKPTSDKIPIVLLGPNQRIILEAYARLGRGKEHIKWAPATVSVATYVPVVKVDRDKCTDCGDCVNVCPTGALKMVNGKLQVYEDRCTLCRQCTRTCAYDAITLTHKEGEYYLMVESSGALSPRTILVESVKEIIKKLDTLLSEISSIEEAVEGGAG